MLESSEKALFVGLAGPGTGKSHTFKTIIESDKFKDKKVLVLSFINKLVDDLAADLKDYKNVDVLTLHSFALREYKGMVKDIKIRIDLDLDEIVGEDYYFINDKKNNFKEKIYEGRLSNDEEKFYKERAKFYQSKDKLYSFNSIIYATNRLFESDETKIPSEYDLVLIDEFQDFNQLEYNLIELLNKRNKIIVVGDDDQSLYDWKSAKPALIRSLYSHDDTDEFSLDYCYRCTEVIVDAVNSLIKNAKSKGFLQERLDGKKFLYPKDQAQDKIDISNKYQKIDFIPVVSGDLLIYQLAQRIKRDIQGTEDNRILVLSPSHFKQSIYEGLVKNGFNVVEFELFIDEKRNDVKHKRLIDIFETLARAKTDNLSLRKILFLYFTETEMKDLIIKSHESKKGIWSCLKPATKKCIEQDIEIFKKAKAGKVELTSDELKRFCEIFNLKNLISKMIKGFEPNKKGSIEIEMTTTMSSKGLSADFVYYIGIDDRDMLNKDTGKLTDQKICEFLVGMTRAKKKLTLFTLKDQKPKILELVSEDYINRIEQKKHTKIKETNKNL